MMNGGDVDGILVSLIKEHPIVATSKTKSLERRLEFLDVASTDSRVPINAVQNLQRRFAVDGAEINTGFR